MYFYFLHVELFSNLRERMPLEKINHIFVVSVIAVVQ